MSSDWLCYALDFYDNNFIEGNLSFKWIINKTERGAYSCSPFIPSRPLWTLMLKTPIKNAYPTAAKEATILSHVLTKRQMYNGT